jgi:hypothetical protein
MLPPSSGLSTIVMETACSSDTPVSANKILRCHNLEDQILKWRDAERIILRCSTKGIQQKPQLKGDFDHVPFQSCYFRNKPVEQKERLLPY